MHIYTKHQNIFVKYIYITSHLPVYNQLTFIDKTSTIFTRIYNCGLSDFSISNFLFNQLQARLVRHMVHTCMFRVGLMTRENIYEFKKIKRILVGPCLCVSITFRASVFIYDILVLKTYKNLWRESCRCLTEFTISLLILDSTISHQPSNVRH